MDDLKAYASVTKVVGRKGLVFECEPYLSHPQFSHDNELCAQLHFTYLSYVPDRSRSKAMEVRRAIVLFLDFRQEYQKRNPTALHLNSVADLTSDVMRHFERYLQKERKLGRLSMRPETPLARFRSALNHVATHTGEIPPIQMPRIRYDRSNKTEPLDESTFEELVSALKTHVDKLRALLDNRIKVETATPYTLEELTNLVSPPVTCESLVRWYQHSLESSSAKDKLAIPLKDWLSRSKDPVLKPFQSLPSANGELMRAWHAYYESEGQNFKLPIPVNPFATNLSNLCLDNCRAMKTLIEHGYPLGLSLQELKKYDSRQKSAWYERTGSALECVLHYYQRQRLADVVPRPKLSKFLHEYYPSALDMAVIIIFLMLQTGWNKEVVLAINSENFESKLSGIFVEDEITIISEKNRSQGANLPYYSPKLFKATSNKKNKYSAYNLIKIAKALSAPFSNFKVDLVCSGDDLIELSTLFTCLRSPSVWNQFGRFYSLSHDSLFKAGVKEFLKIYPIHANGYRLTKVEELTPALRTTWVLMQQKDKPLSLIALLQGHDSVTTTDIFYDSSGIAMKKRRARLRSELDNVAHLLRTRKFSGLVGKMASVEQLNNGLTIFFFPGHEKGIWGCRNRFLPDWPGFQQRVALGQKCTPSVNCLFCSQCYVFEDSLPYLIDRHYQIESQLVSSNESDFSSSLNAEHEVIEWLISNWGDDRALQKAFAYQQQYTPLFPVEQAAFDVLFDDSEM